MSTSHGYLTPLVADKSLVIFDVDGVLWRSGEVAEDAPSTLRLLRQANKHIRLLTNDATNSRRSRAELLTASGLQVERHELVTASYLAAEYLRSLGAPDSLVLATGYALEEFIGLTIDSSSPEVVIIGDWFAGYSRSVLEAAYHAVSRGATLASMQRNRFWSDGTAHGIDAGFWVAGLEYCTRSTARLIGKPALDSYSHVLRQTSTPPERALFLTDDPYSDAVGARNAGIESVLIESIVHEQGSLGSPFPVYSSVGQALIRARANGSLHSSPLE
jgi:HAD superfamily hydrolase (TIGR01450 family)